MNSTKNNKNKFFSLITAGFFAAVVLLGLQACGGGDSGGGDGSTPVVDADPAGYYNSGSATVKNPDFDATEDLVIDDLQAMVNGNRIMMMSLSNALMYDVTITDITGNDFSGDVDVYKNMDAAASASGAVDAVIKTTIKGTITEGAQITGTIEGTTAGSGDFTVTFSKDNSIAAELANVINRWGGAINTVPQLKFFEFEIKDAGVVEVDGLNTPDKGIFSPCRMTGTVAPVENAAFFTLNLNLTQCASINNRNGDYTGLVTTLGKANTNDTLVVMFNNGVVAGMAEWGICSTADDCAQTP